MEQKVKSVKMALLALGLLLINGIYASNYYWIANSSSSWNNSANWSSSSGGPGGAGIPSIGDQAIFDGNGNGHCNLNANVTVDDLQIINGYGGDLNANSSTLTILSSIEIDHATVNSSRSDYALVMNGGARARFDFSTLNAHLKVVSNEIFMEDSRFNKKAYFEKNGPSIDQLVGGNIFNDSTWFKSVDGALEPAYTHPDIYNGYLSLLTEGDFSSVSIGNNSSGTKINGDVYICSHDTGTVAFGLLNGTVESFSDIVIDPTSEGHIIFANFIHKGPNLSLNGANSILTFEKGSEWNSKVDAISSKIELSGSTFHRKSSFLMNGADEISVGRGGNTFNDEVTLKATAGYFRLAIVEGDVFNAPLTIAVDNEARIYMAHRKGSTLFNDDVSLELEDNKSYIYFGVAGGDSELRDGKTISVARSNGGLVFFKNFVQLGTTLQNLVADKTTIRFEKGTIWNGDLFVSSIKPQLNGSTFNGVTGIQRAGKAATALGNGGCTFNDSTIISTDKGRIFLGRLEGDTFNGPVVFDSRKGKIFTAHSSNGNVFNDDIYILGSKGLSIGQNGGTSSLAAGKNLNLDPNQLGLIELFGFTQSGVNPQDLNNSTATIRIKNSNWFGSLNIQAKSVEIENSNFYNAVAILKMGNQSNYSAGGNDFHADLRVEVDARNSTEFTLSGTAGNNYYGNVHFVQTKGKIYPAYSGNSVFEQDLTFESSNPIELGKNGGLLTFEGAFDQTLNVIGTYEVDAVDLKLNKTAGDVILNGNLSVSGNLDLLAGHLRTTSSELLEMQDNSSVSSASTSSFVDGPMIKYGDDGFLFPVGKNTSYRPIAIDGSDRTTDSYEAEYFDRSILLPRGIMDPSLDEVNGCEFWALWRLSGNSKVKVALAKESTMCTFVPFPKAVVSGYRTFAWRDYDGLPVNHAAHQLIESSNEIDDFGFFTFAYIESANPLPIELISFTADDCLDKVCLNWITATEINNDYFTVERSLDGKNWEKVVEVKGGGNCSEKRNYTAVDTKPYQGKSYYRLKQTDFNGDYSYSQIELVERGIHNTTIIRAYPNPTEAQFTLEGPADELENIRVYSIAGSELTPIVGIVKVSSDKYIVDISKLQNGVYLIRTTSETVKINKG